VADIVLCELVWVLSRRLGLDRESIADAIEQVLNAELVVTADAGITARAGSLSPR
jgi:predicted nucleic-acid-binding protein